MTFAVEISIDFEDQNWIAMERWCECFAGEYYTDRDNFTNCNSEGKIDSIIYVFKREIVAKKFASLFNRPIVSYEIYKEFWLNEIGRGRLNAHFEGLGWEPESVFLTCAFTAKQRQLIGARASFKRGTGWFFEKECDAFMFLFE